MPDVRPDPVKCGHKISMRGRRRRSVSQIRSQILVEMNIAILRKYLHESDKCIGVVCLYPSFHVHGLAPLTTEGVWLPRVTQTLFVFQVGG